MVFCEVLDASKNKGREEIHGVFDLDRYDPQNPATYHVIAQDELEDTVLDNVNMYQQLKIFTRDNVDKQDSLLSNGVVDISLIDSPGLNRDSLKTTQLFARQEEIDVVVFVVNAENHFTLSGQEFLASAGKEKAHIFTVVNRFDAIKRKDKCRRMIMDQIKELSAETYDEAENLVHFVSAKNLVVDGSAKPSPEFALMEKKLRWWTLGQRFKSKLAPAQRYMLNLLSDLYLISAENIELAAKKIQEINSVLRSDMPKYENLLDKRANAVKSIESMVEESQEKVRTYTADFLSTSIGNLDAAGDSVEWPGLFNCYYYAENVFLSNVNYLYSQISESENFARFVINSSANSLVSLDQQRRSLESDPSDIPSLSSDIVDSQLASLTFSHSHSISPFLDAFSIQLSDFIDLEKFKFKLPTSITLTASSFVVLSNSTLLSNFVTLFRFSSNYISLSPNSSSSVSKFVLFSAGCIGLGSILYMLYEVDHTIKHNISSRLKAGLHAEKFADTHANRLATETCRAISPFAWRLQNSFQRMVEAEELKRADHLRSRHLSQDAQIYFDDLKTRVFELVSSIRSVNSSAKFI
ncbi:Transmembrane GTPase fzo1 [Zancudomyces culisetae]|uniref:Transmembrane GTPase fzo1 n=1 Tax=Zancudomyces culisetae TaxID=1213189 RepID=A0A1R1PRN6_ZANCU|nr:Transmembrane GTPase fzo1 [Zancudomyces culisetae]|eukprot:OMH83618.1 Transmembrane GTPase fzo1 [Zancudomyces culisetae]